MKTPRTPLPAARLLLSALVCAVLPAALLAGPARAGQADFTVTQVTELTYFQGLGPQLTDCATKYDNPLILFTAGTAADYPPDQQVRIEGLRVEVSSADGEVLGTVTGQDAFLMPSGDPNEGSFLNVYCRQWNKLMPVGLGGSPDSQYLVRLLGPGKAYESNEGKLVGTVDVTDESFPVTLKQLAKTTRVRAAKVRGGVKIYSKVLQWRQLGDGTYAFRAAKRVKVTLQHYRRNRWRSADTTMTSRKGKFAFKYKPGREGDIVRFRIAGHASSESTYWVTRAGKISLSGR